VSKQKAGKLVPGTGCALEFFEGIAMDCFFDFDRVNSSVKRNGALR
jgi:hypothetical protein